MKFLVCGMVFLCSFCLTATAQEPFRILFYNTENLFDCRHDSLKNDVEFLPDGNRHWSFYRFRDKIYKLSKVIVAAGTPVVPDLVGLCEVENDSCLIHLTRYSPLREAGYRYVMTHSPDLRGIDVALLYQRGTFKVLGHREIRVPSEQLSCRPTRNILHVAGRLITGQILDVFVCHQPSRSGGEKASEPHRLLAAKTLKEAVDSVRLVRRAESPAHPEANIVIMGDFNDYSRNRSIREVLGAQKPHPPYHAQHLYDVLSVQKGGTYRYKGEWGLLDHFILSGNLLVDDGQLPLFEESRQRKEEEPPVNQRGVFHQNAYLTSPRQARILKFPFLLEEDDRYGGMTPKRTYHGWKYKGGFSDHLPICLDLLMQAE